MGRLPFGNEDEGKGDSERDAEASRTFLISWGGAVGSQAHGHRDPPHRNKKGHPKVTLILLSVSAVLALSASLIDVNSFFLRLSNRCLHAQLVDGADR